MSSIERDGLSLTAETENGIGNNIITDSEPFGIRPEDLQAWERDKRNLESIRDFLSIAQQEGIVVTGVYFIPNFTVEQRAQVEPETGIQTEY